MRVWQVRRWLSCEAPRHSWMLLCYTIIITLRQWRDAALCTCALSRCHLRLLVPVPNQTVSFNEMTKAVPWSGVRYPITERLRKIMSGQPPKTLRKRLQISTICLVNLIDMSPGLWIQPQRSLSRKMTLRSGTSTRKDHGGQHYL